MILAACMILPPVAFKRWVHCTTIALWLSALWLSALWLSALWLYTLVLARLRFAALRLATLLAIHGRTAKAIALRLRAIARACHVRAALWLRTGCIAIPLLAGARLILRHRGGRKWVLLRSRHRWRRLVCGLGILSLQRRDAESERTTKPGESVGLGFHERAVLVDCGSINYRQGQEFHTPAPLR